MVQPVTSTTTPVPVQTRKRKRRKGEPEKPPEKVQKVWHESIASPLHQIPFGDVTMFMNRDNNKRKYTSIYSNSTMSRSSLIWHSKTECGSTHVINTEQNLRLPTKESVHLRDRVVDHAYRRVQLFYYLALVYYRENLKISRTTTDIQHGVGPFYGVAAAHSCILPHVTDDFFPHLNQILNNRGVTPAVEARLKVLGLPSSKILNLKVRLAARKKKSPYIDVREYFPEVDTSSLICRDSYFYQVMNSTCILPNYVNSFDMCIEREMRSEALAILNRVSAGELPPYEATEEFVQKTCRFLIEAEEEAKEKLKYLQELYRRELALAHAETLVKFVDVDNRVEALEALRTYILCAYDVRKRTQHLKDMKKSVSLSRYLKKRMAACAPVLEPVMAWLKTNRKTIEEQVAGPFKDHPFIVKALLKEMKEAINKRPWCPWGLGWVRDAAVNGVEVARLQRQGTVLPDEEQLSGVYENGVLRKMTGLERAQQKLDIIKRVGVVYYDDHDFVYESLFPDVRPQLGVDEFEGEAESDGVSESETEEEE